MFNFFDFGIETYDLGDGDNIGETIPGSGGAGTDTPIVGDGDRPEQGRSVGGIFENDFTIDSNGNIHLG